jgi:hypothetical protein
MVATAADKQVLPLSRRIAVLTLQAFGTLPVSARMLKLERLQTLRVIVALAPVAVEELLALYHQLVVAVTTLRFLVGLGRFYLPFLLVFQE